MVERFNGRIQREVLGLTVASHRDLERLLKGFNAAYNARRQRVLGGRSPEQVVRASACVTTRASPTPATGHRLIRASCPRHCWSSSVPRTSHNQTPSTTWALRTAIVAGGQPRSRGIGRARG